MYDNYSVCANPHARTTRQVNLDSDKRKLYSLYTNPHFRTHAASKSGFRPVQIMKEFVDKEKLFLNFDFGQVGEKNCNQIL